MNKVITLAVLAGLSSATLAGVPTTVADFGLIADSANATATIPAFGVDVFWISFDLDGTETYVDITTSFGSGATDTEIGLFNSAGDVIADDDGLGRASVLTFGNGSGLVMGDLFELDGTGVADGSDGSMLSAGTYYVAFGGFDTTYSAGFGASSTFFDFDDAPLSITVYANNTPTPGAISLLALAGLGATRRRR